MSALTVLLFKLNTLQEQEKKLVKVWVSRSHGRMLNLHHDNDAKEVVSSQPGIAWYKSANQRVGIPKVFES